MSGKDKLISVEHLKWNVGGIKCGTLSVDYLNWILDHEEPAVDAVPVIRCKNCEDCTKTKLFDGTRWNYCERLRCVVQDDDFCCWAELRHPKIKAKESEK